MRIGIGVTSYNRPVLSKMWTQWLNESLEDGVTDYVLIRDCPNIAKAKNKCLNVLDDCDYIFLLDDDCSPTRREWIDFFINAHKKTGEHHFLYLKDQWHNKIKTKQKNGVKMSLYKECGGVFMFLTKEVIEKVGGFNKNFGQYGFEHAEYSQRIHAAGLTSHPYIKVKDTECVLEAMDYGEGLAHIDHKPSVENKEELIEQNRPIFIEAMNNLKIYQPI